MTVAAVRTPLAVLLELMAIFAGVALFVAVFGQGDGPPPSFIAVTVAVIGSFALARLVQHIDIDQSTMRTAGVVIIAVGFFVLARLEYAPDEWIVDPGWIGGVFADTRETIRPNAHVIAGAIALTPVWFRGIWRGVAPIEFEGVLTSASLGLLAVMIAALAAPDTREPVSWGAFAIAYAALALVTLALYQAPEPQIPLWKFAERWTLPLGVIAGATVLVALVAAAVDPEAFGFLSPVGTPLRVAGEFVATYVLGPILWVLLLPFRGAMWLVGQLLPDDNEFVRPIEGPAEEQPPKEREERERALWQQILLWAGAIAIAIPLVAGALMLLWHAFRRFARAQDDDVERRDDIEPASSLLGDLGDMFGAFARRLRRTPRSRAAIEIRRLYFEMLDAAAARGVERPAATTPLQFAPALDAHFASAVPSSISRAFTVSRYGEVEIDAGEVRELRSSWDRIQRGDAGALSS